MGYQTIVCRKENNLMIIELIVSEIHEAGISQFAHEFSNVCDSIKLDANVWAVSLIFSGEAFLSGIAKKEKDLKAKVRAGEERWSIVEPISSFETFIAVPSL